jgi:hypothetical protein
MGKGYGKEVPTFEPGDLVWFSRRHITATHPSSKLDVKRLGPFKILEKATLRI